MRIHDNFLEPDEYRALRDFAVRAQYDDVVNPVDNVVYPRVCSDIPGLVESIIFHHLSRVIGRFPTNPVLFLRMSPEGVHCPHQVHHDGSMGSWSLMLYLNEPGDCRGGTAFVGHVATGMGYAPAMPEFVAVLEAEQNNPTAWAIHDLAPMAPNRAVIFKADRLHRAEPVGGFGSTPEDSRLVLTCFFD